MFNKKIFIGFLFLIFFLLPCSFVQAQGGFETSDSGGTVQLKDPLGMENQENAPQIFIGRIISASLGIVGSLALLMFIYGGFTWMLSSGNSEKVEKGKQILIWSIIGLIVIFTSYILVEFVIFDLIGAG